MAARISITNKAMANPGTRCLRRMICNPRPMIKIGQYSNAASHTVQGRYPVVFIKRIAPKTTTVRPFMRRRVNSYDLPEGRSR